MADESLREKVVIVTGASSGIGRKVAQQLADQGAWLVLAARSREGLEETAQGCRQRGGRALVVPTDVSAKAQCQALIERAAAEYGRIDALVNNAGISQVARFDELDDLEILEHILHINYLGSVYCTFYALPYLKESKGRIVGISSLSGKVGTPGLSAYSASKHAMAGFFDALRIELAGQGVSVTMIYPSLVATARIEARGGPPGAGMLPAAMPVETCARLIVEAMARRKREVVMTLTGKMALWLRLIAPGILEAMVRRATAGVE